MFETVLVADRGATARRVVRTCQRSGARTAVVRAADDGEAPHVRIADETVPLGGSGWAQSYGDPVKVLEAARRTGAQAVHPGAGPLAGDVELARAVADAGLAWLGLPVQVLERTEQQAADLLVAHGVPLAGRDGRLLVVTVLETAGRARVLGVREPLLDGGAPRADRQPVGLPAAVLERAEHLALLTARTAGAGALAAVGLRVSAAGEVAVGTLLPGASTEAVAGVDLVALQLQLAAGDRLPRSGSGSAHAVALHLRVADRFAGRLRRLSLPVEGEGVAVDAAVAAGDRVSLASDRTLAVLTVAAPDLAGLRTRAAAALDAVEVEGVPTSLGSLRALLSDL